MADDSDVMIRFGADTGDLDAALKRLGPQFAALRGAVGAAGAAAPAATAQFRAMAQEVDRAAAEMALSQVEALRRTAEETEAAQLDQVKAARAGGGMSIEAARDAQLGIVQTYRATVEASLEAAEASAAGQAGLETRLAAQLEALRHQSAEAAIRINAEAAEAVGRQWQRVNQEIGRDFGSTLVNGLTGKGGVAGALGKLADEALSGLAGDVGTALAGHAESALGIGGQSPGGVLSGLANSLGIGGITSWLGLTGAGTGAAGDAAATTSAATLQLAATTLEPAGPALTSAASALAAAASALGGAAGTADATGGGVLGSLADILPFADGGTPPVGVPSLVGERGPELFVPRAAGTIYPNGMLGRLAHGNARRGWTLRGTADPARHAAAAVAGSPAARSAAQGSGETHLHYSPTVNAPAAPSLGQMLTSEASTMRRWLRNELRNGTLA